MPIHIMKIFNIAEDIAAYTPVADEEFYELSLNLYKNPKTHSVLKRVGFRENFTETEEEVIDNLTISLIREKQWEKPDPRNIIISIALARRFAGNIIDAGDRQISLEFIADHRCDGVAPTFPMSYRPLKLSEFLLILGDLKTENQLIQPYMAVRQKTMLPGQSFFGPSEKKKIDRYMAVFIANELYKYALLNRCRGSFSRINMILDLYADNIIEDIEGAEAIQWLLDRNRGLSANEVIIDDRGGEG